MTTIIHDTDADGIMAACLVTESLNEPVQCIGIAPADFKVKQKDLMSVEGNIFIVDLCPDEELADFTFMSKPNMLIFDHHKSSEWLKSKPYGRHDLNHSACGLVKKYFIDSYYDESKPLLWLCDYIEDRDLWRFKLPASKEINKVINSELILAPVHMRQVADNIYHNEHEVTKLGHELIRFENNSINKKLLEYNKMFLELQDIRVPTINHTGNPSDLLNQALERFNIEVASSFFILKDKVIVSLRARDKFDCSKLAQAYNGGGHKNAAGFSITLNELSRILK